jgi:hypothetical protein
MNMLKANARTVATGRSAHKILASCRESSRRASASTTSPLERPRACELQAGVACHDPVRGSWRSYTTEDGLRAAACISVKADTAGNTWVGHRNGVSW